jgi:hypothetical protein
MPYDDYHDERLTDIDNSRNVYDDTYILDNDIHNDAPIDYVLVRRDDYDNLVTALHYHGGNDIYNAAANLIEHGPGEYDYGVNDDDEQHDPQSLLDPGIEHDDDDIDD